MGEANEPTNMADKKDGKSAGEEKDLGGISLGKSKGESKGGINFESLNKGYSVATEPALTTFLAPTSLMGSSLFSEYIRPQYVESNNILSKYLGERTLDKQLALTDEITGLKRKLKTAGEELQKAKEDKKEKENAFIELQNQISAKEKVMHILSRISEKGRTKLLESSDFQSLFNNSNKCDTVVVSIDIRRSTELMLKARTPEAFSKFITELSVQLSNCIMDNFGIFDKFTGDGILAFFPKFYSGEAAIIRATSAANQCHKIFEKHYSASKSCFNVFIKDVGLGIGIDYGNVTLVNTQTELTVVGVPVVYACRFSGAKAGETLFNQPALEEVLKSCAQYATVSESSINIKNEGIAIGYNISLNNKAFDLVDPNWDELIEINKRV